MFNWCKWSLTGRYVAQKKPFNWFEVLRCALLMFSDVVAVFSITFVLYTVIIWRAVSPTQIGFACGDQSIRNPHHKNTVSTKMLLSVCLGGPLVVVAIASFINYKCLSICERLISTIRYSTFVYLDYIFSFWVTTAILDYLKCHVSRLRPNFIEMCKPDTLNLCDTNPAAFITEYTCTTHWKDARVSQTSFPSGHSGACAFVFLFIVYFFQRKMIVSHATDNRYMVTDFWHFPTDVLGGIVVAIIIFYLSYPRHFINHF